MCCTGTCVKNLEWLERQLLLSITVGCLIYGAATSPPPNTTIKIGVLLVENTSAPFDLLHVGPALSIAFENIERDFGIKFDVVYRNYTAPSCSWTLPIGILSELYYYDQIKAVIGPACSMGVISSIHLAEYLQLPMVTGLGDLAIRTYPDDMLTTLTRLSYNLGKMSLSVSAIMEEHNWRHSVIMYDAIIPFGLIGAGVVEDFRKMPTLARPYDINFDPSKTTDYREMLITAKQHARVIIIFCFGDLFREIMYQAYDVGMANGDYVFITLELFPSEWLGFFQEFFRGDDKDAGVLKAYESVLLVTLTQPDISDPDFQQFTEEVKRRAVDLYGYTFKPDEEVSYFITAFYDSAIYLANAYNRTIYEGGDINDGLVVAQKLWNTSFKGITGLVAIDEIGDRVADFDVLDMMSPTTQDFQKVGNFRGSTQRYTKNGIIVWPRGQPLDVPVCGFTGERCQHEEEGVSLDLIIVLNVVAFSTFALAITISGVLYRRLLANQEISKRLWLVQPEEITIRKMHGNSSYLSRSRVSFASNISMATQPGASQQNMKQELVFTQTGVCHSITVSVRALLTQTLDINNPLEREFHEMHKLSHSNLAKFVGACVKPGFIRLLMEYCPRGSLQDIIHNDSIDLDWNFRYSLISDIIQGMLYLHSSTVQTHGRLSSSNCVIDNRFMLKLTDFGLHSIFNKERQEERHNDTNMRFRKMLWMAPELVRRMETAGIMDPSQPGDVYSFAIILQEIGMRAEPFQENNLEAHEIIAALVDGKTIRPVLTSSDCPQAILDMIEQCWDDKTSNRPTFVTIDQRFRKHRDGKSTNIMDNLLQRMSQYADNLEALAAERTKQYLEEKTRTEELLLRLLPKFVVKQLQTGNVVVPELFESVTIYFSDIVSFTSMAAASTPIQVVDFLNDLFTKFDKTVDQYDVYKVETIGDAYMVVSGLPERNGTRHVSEVADMALSMVAVVRRFRIKHKPKQHLQIRIGIHSGPVVAGVVGLTMPRYCLFGDTVNTASRMESTSEPMKIQLSSGTKDVIDIYPRFIVDERGETEVKGKGRMKTYWLLGKKNEASPGLQMTGNLRQTVIVDPIIQMDRT